MVIHFFLYRFLSILIGILYPSYQTYKSLKYQHIEQYQALLCYWILFSFFQLFEILFDQILSLVLPFYYELKLFLLFWLTYQNISQMIFSHWILIYLNQYEHDIDYVFQNTIHRLTESFLKFFLVILNQQQQQPPPKPYPIKTNFASQYRQQLHSIQRK